MKRAYELCRKDFFDDYILFWPMTFDASRLLMSVHNALRELAAIRSSAPSATEFAIPARHMGEFEPMLNHQLEQGKQHIEASSRAMRQAEQAVETSMDKLSQQVIEGQFSATGEADSADKLRSEISRIKHEEIRQHFHVAAESAKPAKQWVRELKQKCEPIMASARTLNAMAMRVPLTVMVVDDDEFQSKIIGKLLKDENYNLIFATDGIDALNILRKVKPDIILMDISMPEMDGIETTRRLKTAPRFANTPVIMITGNSEGSVVVDSIKAGAVDFLVKPFDREKLLAKINRALGATN